MTDKDNLLVLLIPEMLAVLKMVKSNGTRVRLETRMALNTLLEKVEKLK